VEVADPIAIGRYEVSLTDYVPTVPNVGVPAFPIVANRLELTLWSCRRGENPGDLELVQETMTPLDPLSLEPSPGNTLSFLVDVPSEEIEDPGVFALLIRPVRFENGVTVPAGNPQVCLLMTSQSGFDWVFGLSITSNRVPAVTPKPPLPPIG
jgi:hypothetical protein